MKVRSVRYFVTALAAVSLLAGCGGDSGGIEVSDAWARTSPSMASAGAAYMAITNSGDVDDALIGASVDADIAGSVEIHETVAMGSDTTMGDTGTDTTTGGGMMTMQPVERVIIPAGESIALEPGGYHLMFLDLVAPLEAGEDLSITLTFEEAGEQIVTAEVRDTNP